MENLSNQNRTPLTEDQFVNQLNSAIGKSTYLVSWEDVKKKMKLIKNADIKTKEDYLIWQKQFSTEKDDL